MFMTGGSSGRRAESARKTAARLVMMPLVALMPLILPGCHAPPDFSSAMIPTPAIYWSGGVDPFLSVPESRCKTAVEVFYACDHARANTSGQPEYQKGVRSQLLRVGTVSVQLGGNKMSWETLTSLSRMEERPEKPTSRIVAVNEYGVLEATAPPPALQDSTAGATSWQSADGQFASAINQRLSKSRRKDINVFVHGFNTPLENHMKLVGQLHYFAGLEGVTIGYSWPSQVQLIGGYHADKANARFTVRHFRLLLKFLTSETKANRINILAHSAGCPVVVDSLRQIRFLHEGQSPAGIQRKTKIETVILGAPDGDLDWFINACLDGWMQTARNVNVYASNVDRALRLSSGIYEAPRTGASVGHFGRPQLDALQKYGNLTLIDATSAKHRNKLITRHQYYYMNEWVSSDVLLALIHGLPPERRGLSRGPNQVYWTFPVGYDQRVRTIARGL